MRKLFAFALLLFLTLSCNSEKNSEQRYSDFPETENLYAKEIILSDSVFFRYPQMVVSDSLCCIFDSGAPNGYYCHIFSFPDFKYKYSLVGKGRAANELANAKEVELRGNDLYLIGSTKILKCNISNPKIEPVKAYDIKERLLRVAIIDDSTYVGSSEIYRLNRAMMYNKEGDVITSLLEPLEENDMPKESYFSPQAVWQSFIRYDKNADEIFFATICGEVLDRLNLKTKEHKSMAGPLGEPEIYDGGGWYTNKYNGFGDLNIYEDDIYTIFTGSITQDVMNETTTEKPMIQVYDRDFNPKKRYIVD